MKNFTLRQVRGKAIEVLDACDRDGRVRITRRDGQSCIVERIKEARRDFKSGRLSPATPAEIMRKLCA